MDIPPEGQFIKYFGGFFLFLLTAPVCVAGGWTRGLMCPSPHRDEFEIPNLEDLRLEIPGDEPNTLYISAIGTFSLKQTK